MDVDYLVDVVFKQQEPLNIKRIRKSNSRLFISATEYKTGNPKFFTNADDIFEALRLQDDLQTRYTGGTVLHGFVGERLPSAESTKMLVKKIAENFHLPYFTITPTFSVCPIHGYIEGEHEYCPLCDEEMGYVENMEKIRAAV